MASILQAQEKVISDINSAKAVVDEIATIMEGILFSPALTSTFATNPIGFLLYILKELGVSYEDIRLWLTNFLIYIIPALEVSVKAILLTNLKNMISCSVDPRIPNKYRKRHKNPEDSETSQEYGIDINIESIDYLDKLSTNPLSDFGSEMYFGLEGIDDSYKFARADDMDAFLWFVIHKGKFPSSNIIEDVSEIGGNVSPSNGTLLSALDITYSTASTNSTSNILLGNTFTLKNGQIISMCIDRKYNEKNEIISNTLVPVSDDWHSVNWYARRADELGKNLGFGWGVNQKNANTKYKGKQRNFSKERALCNFQYIDQSSSTSPITGLVNNKIRFTILPKPFMHIPNLDEGEPPWRYKKLLFNENGDYDPNGKYTIIATAVEEKKTISDEDGKIKEVYFEYSVNNDAICTLDAKSGKIKVEKDFNQNNKTINYLIECYPGLTVYEFNYDYVMSIKLFDAKVLATTLLDTLQGLRVGVSGSVKNPLLLHQEASEMINEIVRNIIESDETVESDCYYSFSNEKYERLLKKAEEKKANKKDFSSVNEILNEYDSNAELHKQVDVINRAITEASRIESENSENPNKEDVEYGFAFDLVENLVNAIVTGVLSPKILLLLEVNQKIMGGTWEKFTIKDLLKAMSSIIVSLVKEITDLVIEQLTKFVMDELKPIKETLQSILTREQLDYYSDAVKDIIENCASLGFMFGKTETQGTELDRVDYADIDFSQFQNNEQPIKNNC